MRCGTLEKTDLPDFAFARSPLNRLAHIRQTIDEVEKRRKSSTSRCIWVHGDSLRFSGDTLDVALPDAGQPCILLGEDHQGISWFASFASATDSLKPLRGLLMAGELPSELLTISAQARSLVHWHETHGFCAKCGAASAMLDSGYRRHCKVCQTDHFPRTDPVVIMAIIYGGKTLLGRQKTWPEGMFSTLAGFVEPGETLEAAVAREVFEEVGIGVVDINYVASQPWPFPSSLMIGMIAAANDDRLLIDESEIETARWFEADELRMMLDRTHPQGLTASRPDAIAYHLAQEALRRIAK
jgi:NAD+ diphosphatase